MITVYKVTSPSRKTYIGVTSKSLTRRKTQHESSARAGSQFAFHRAIRKYGDSLVWEEVAKVESVTEAFSLEKSLISEHGSFGVFGYNRTAGGEGPCGLTFSQSEETKAKIKENNSKFWTGKSRSEETKRKCSEAQKGKPRGPLSEETKAKLRVAALRRAA